jgi:Arc/MetJ-type ribon-helix-helix transcriptional regulator
MLQTINISLPDSLAQKIDAIIEKGDFSSKSEFFRHILRLYLDSHIVNAEPEVFEKMSLNVLRDGLKHTGKYTDTFIDSVLEGVKESSLYKNEHKSSKPKDK